MITLGAMALAFGLIRLFVFRIPESPKFLISKGRDAAAVEAVNYIARYNGKPETLTLEMLQAIDQSLGHSSSERQDTAEVLSGAGRLSWLTICKESFRDYKGSGYRKLFNGKQMARHTTLIWLIWLLIGVAYPLYFAFITSYLENNSNYSADTSFDHTYKVYCIVSGVGIVGPVAAGFGVETRLGRRWMMAMSAALTGVFLFAYTAVKTEAANIGFQCATAMLGNFGMSPTYPASRLCALPYADPVVSEYAVMFAFTPESFPGPVRGTATGTAATLLRFGGLLASLASAYAGYTAVPIYLSAALWILAGLLCVGLPYETHGHASL